MTRYTLWKSFIGNTGDCVLLDKEGAFITKKNAMKKAYKLLAKLKDDNETILVRKVKLNDPVCEEWELTKADLK